MKQKIRFNLLISKSKAIVLLVAMILFASGSYPQKKSRSYLKFNYFKGNDGNKTLVAELKTKVDGKFAPVQNVAVSFFIKTDSVDQLLSIMKTNYQGIARLSISDNLNIKSDTSDIYYYYLQFEGNDTLKSKSVELEIQYVEMDLKLDVIDSVKTITLNVYSLKRNDKKEPLNEVEISFYVQRLFSLLPIGKSELENGTCTLEFPTDLPGDSAGNVLIYAKIEDNDYYGNVEKKSTIDWGIPVTLNENNYNPFTGGSFLSFMLISVLIISLVLFVINKKMGKAKID